MNDHAEAFYDQLVSLLGRFAHPDAVDEDQHQRAVDYFDRNLKNISPLPAENAWRSMFLTLKDGTKLRVVVEEVIA